MFDGIETYSSTVEPFEDLDVLGVLGPVALEYFADLEDFIADTWYITDRSTVVALDDFDAEFVDDDCPGFKLGELGKGAAG